MFVILGGGGRFGDPVVVMEEGEGFWGWSWVYDDKFARVMDGPRSWMEGLREDGTYKQTRYRDTESKRRESKLHGIIEAKQYPNNRPPIQFQHPNVRLPVLYRSILYLFTIIYTSIRNLFQS